MDVGIWRAAYDGGVREVDRLVGQNPGLLNAKDERYGQTPLMRASREGHVGVVRGLLDKGASINEHSHAWLTAVWCASAEGRLPVVRLLLERGADPAIANHWGATPLLIASRDGHLEIVRLLLDHPSAKATIDHRDEYSKTALWHASYYGRGGSCGRCSNTGPIPRSLPTTAPPPWPSLSRISLFSAAGSLPRAAGSAWRLWR
jgi:hypothetical protein